MKMTHHRIEPVLTRTPGGYRPARTSVANGAGQPYEARAHEAVDRAVLPGSAMRKSTPKAATRGFKQRAFERTPYVIPQEDVEAAAAHIAQARDESHIGQSGDAPKRKTYLCRGIFVSFFGILAVAALSVGAFEIAAVFALLMAFSTRIGPDIQASIFENKNGFNYMSHDYDTTSSQFTNPRYSLLPQNIFHHSRY